jgi:hypothetical protein
LKQIHDGYASLENDVLVVQTTNFV